MASGHQSRLASAVTAGSVVTEAQASPSWASTASGTATAGWSRWARTVGRITGQGDGRASARPDPGRAGGERGR